MPTVIAGTSLTPLSVKIRMSILGICMAAVLASAAPAMAEPTKENDEAAIRALEDRLVQANRIKDVAMVMDLYAPDTDVLIYDVVPPRQFSSKGNWQQNVTGYFASFDGPAGLEIEELNVTASGDLAYANMIQHFFGKQKAGGQIDLRARVTDVYRKIRGRWYIVHEHVSVPVNISNGQADLQSRP